MRRAEPLAAARLPSTLGVRGLLPVVAGLRALGHDPAPILAAVGLDAAPLADPDARVPAAQVMRVLLEGVARTGDDHLGLHLAAHAPLETFDVHTYVVLSSPTLGAGYERLARYQRLIHDAARVELSRDGGVAALRHTLPGGLAIPRQSAEFVVAAWLRAGRAAIGEQWTPRAVRFAHPAPSDVAPLAEFFDCRPHFDAGEHALLFDAALLDRACVAADPGLLAVLDRHASALLERVPPVHSLADRVRVEIADGLRRGQVGAAAVAQRLRMSPRTLQRGLAAEGASFAAILDRVRHDAALRALRERELSIAEVGFLLGFAELSSFYRAFKRWTGRTPAEFRNEATDSPGVAPDVGQTAIEPRRGGRT